MPPASSRKTPASRIKPAAKPNQWKLEDAKARFSEVVRQAAASGPQLVTVRGKEAAVILAPAEYRQLLPKPKNHRPLVSFLQSLGLDEIHLKRERDLGREIEL
ncbi:type II toxin-antitoxin system prevent-host-death family antitoxin [Telmatobacter bradus]|uniref:type II toxin-antitoxin system prevent-host-death family antitoxin n=1 Tax=Telmatobacter bradus TaxID=474953 RepID=UPI003B42ACDC